MERGREAFWEFQVSENREAGGLSSSAEEEWLRDQEKYPKILISRRRGGCSRSNRNSLLVIEQPPRLRESNALIAQPLLLYQGGESARLNSSDGFRLPLRIRLDL
jgi:hypothetical protein